MSSPLEADPVIIPLIDGYTVLDVACGFGRWGCLIRSSWFCTERGRDNTQPEYLVGIDIFLPGLRRLKYYRVYDDLIRCDASYLPFKDCAFEVVLASEILEHVEKDRGFFVLKEAERVSKKTAIVATPRFPGKRGGIRLPDGFNPYERHVSKWSIGELRSMGYRVYGIGAPIYLHRCFRDRRKRLFSIVKIVDSVFSALAYIIPYLGWEIVAKKHKQ